MTTLRTLECLGALVEHRSISRAAAALYMSQPALSHQIASLERELGAPVVERLPRGVQLTAAGRAAAEEAELALAAAARAIHINIRVNKSTDIAVAKSHQRHSRWAAMPFEVRSIACESAHATT